MGRVGKFIEEEAKKVFPEVVAIRRDFHAHPELSFQEQRTSEKIASILHDIGLEVKQGIATTGVVGLLRGSADGPTIALRADMDALPITEETGLPYASTRPGVMHACNHDAHMAMLLGAAMVLSKMRADLKGNVKFVFQPAEEGYAGARQMIDEGVLEDVPKIEAAFALHIDTFAPPGMLCVREGPMMACADIFNLTVTGRGGHGAAPHVCVDPIFVSGHVITALQGIASRQVGATDPVVVSICTIHAGDGPTIIPDTVRMSGTVRLFDSAIRESMPSMMDEIIGGVTTAFGASHDLNYVFGYPATINDAGFTSMVHSVAEEILGSGGVHLLPEPRMPAEDFSFFLERVPGTFALLGARSSDREAFPPHSARCSIDEAALGSGVKMHAAVAAKYLGESL